MEVAALVEQLINGTEAANESFTLNDLPQSESTDPPVSILSVSEPEHVNALASQSPLTFETVGITIVYGDNGSGKSGYARLLKSVTRARSQEQILSDVFRDTALATPNAKVSLKSGTTERTLLLSAGAVPELKRVLFYDQACGAEYIQTESDFPYRPPALFVLDGLIKACVALRQRVDVLLSENSNRSNVLPQVNPDIAPSEIGQFLTSLSGQSAPELLSAILERSDISDEAIGKLKAEEIQLSKADPTAEKSRLSRRVDKLNALKLHLVHLEDRLGADAARLLREQRGEVAALQTEASLAARQFDTEPLSGVGGSAWKAMWEAARRFSNEHAYPKRQFPAVDADCRCVLCQQALQEDGAQRLTRFEGFTGEDSQTRLRTVKANWDASARRLYDLRTAPDILEVHLNDLQTEQSDLVGQVRTLVDQAETQRAALVAAATSLDQDLPASEWSASKIIDEIDTASEAVKSEIQKLSSPEGLAKLLREKALKRAELELLRSAKASQPLIVAEIERRRERDVLEKIKNSAATKSITDKITNLSESSITEVVHDAFTRETERLGLERVTISKTRADKGSLLHLPKLVGARQDATVHRVFSEGERTALGLAAFFTEAQLDPSRSALVLDDPVTSLDHIRRGRVAARIAAFGETRQVILFTHDVAFVADIKREAKGLGVVIAERSVARGRGGERKPGSCSATHPWKAKDVGERFSMLRAEIARIKKEAANLTETSYEIEVATWAGQLSETWERIFSQEIVGQILVEGGQEVRPAMVKILAKFTVADDQEFQASYHRVSQWTKRHDKSVQTNYVAPEVSTLEQELNLVDAWYKRVKAYKN